MGSFEDQLYCSHFTAKSLADSHFAGSSFKRKFHENL